MTSNRVALDTESALTYLGKTVLVELVWEQAPEPLWCLLHIVGVVLALEGVYSDPYFLVIDANSERDYPNEMFWSDIRTIRVMRHRDRQGSGNVLDRIAHPNDPRSRAALPARRNSPTVPANGSTGGANP
ncbi:TPA: hypothetical protein NIE75_003753 [Pseudomonas aeruginosa]|nr:hypothetical protein [Pseudomonas aeruginosa]